MGLSDRGCKTCNGTGWIPGGGGKSVRCPGDMSGPVEGASIGSFTSSLAKGQSNQGWVKQGRWYHCNQCGNRYAQIPTNHDCLYNSHFEKLNQHLESENPSETQNSSSSVTGFGAEIEYDFPEQPPMSFGEKVKHEATTAVYSAARSISEMLYPPAPPPEGRIETPSTYEEAPSWQSDSVVDQLNALRSQAGTSPSRPEPRGSSSQGWAKQGRWYHCNQCGNRYTQIPASHNCPAR